MYLSRVGAAASPVTLAQIMQHLRDPLDEAGYIEAIRSSAHNMVSEMTGRTLGAETWDYSVGAVSGDLVLPKSPVQSVTSISYFDAAGVVQTATLGDFYVFKGEDRTIIRPMPGKAWPSLQDREDALTVRFVAGYASLPDALTFAVMFAAESIYEGTPFPQAMELQIAAYRIGWVAA